MATVALWAADLVRGKRRHLHFLQVHKCDVSLGHLVTPHRFLLFFCLHKIVQLTLIDSQRHQNVKVSFVIRVAGDECAFSCPSQSHFYARCTSEATVISPGCCLRAACTILRFVYSCVYLPILILAITRMAGHVKRRFAHSQWMGQYWQHAHRISDQCKGLACTRFTGFQLNSMRRPTC